jgi:hypothetical protein
MATLLCCAACESASCACSVMKCIFSKHNLSRTASNIAYLAIFITMSFVAFILQHWGAPHIDLYSFHIGCENIPNIDVIACQGENAVYRICIGLAIWFFVLSVITTCSKRTHTGYWGIKILVLLILCGGLFFLPIVGHPSYVNIARVISGIFLVSQIIAFIDVAYKWNAFFVDKAYDDYDGEDNRWLVAALVFCIAIMITTIGIIIFLYI